MADGKKNVTIIIKKIQPGHGGAHGGAWKVAFADFMTAMMAFFLVMWLMGSDEETKAAVASYFSNPSSAWRIDVSNDKARPLGDKTGAGENVMNGMEGEVPDDLVKNPERQVNPYTDMPEDKEEPFKESGKGRYGDLPISMSSMRFTIPEKMIFAEGSEELLPNASKTLDKIGELFKSYDGKVQIIGIVDRDYPYDFKLARAVAVAKYFVKKKYLGEENISARAHDRKGEDPPDEEIEGSLLEVIFTKKK